MRDVWKSNTTERGEPSVTVTLTTSTPKSAASCSDFGNSVLAYIVVVDFTYLFAH